MKTKTCWQVEACRGRTLLGRYFDPDGAEWVSQNYGPVRHTLREARKLQKQALKHLPEGADDAAVVGVICSDH